MNKAVLLSSSLQSPGFPNPLSEATFPRSLAELLARLLSGESEAEASYVEPQENGNYV